MTKPVFKTLSLSVLTVVMVAAAPAHELSEPGRASASADPDRGACAAGESIARGWEYQRGLLEGRLEAKAPATLQVKGAIISPPFPTYAPYRKDLPPNLARQAPSDESKSGGHRTSTAHPWGDRF